MLPECKQNNLLVSIFGIPLLVVLHAIILFDTIHTIRKGL